MSTRFRGLLASGTILVAASLLVAQERANPNIKSPGAKVKPGQTIQQQDSTQENTTTRRAPQLKEARQAARAAALDQYALSCIIKGNEGEIEISKIAQQRASSPEVKQFAAQMIKDHTAFLQKLRAAQGNEAADGQPRQRRADRQRNTTDTANSNAEATDARGRARTGDNAATGDMARGHSIPVQTLTAVSDEIHDRCQAALKQELEDKQGADFDRMFMGVQCGAHMQMASTLDVLQSHVSQDLSQTLKEGSETAKKHWNEAKQVAMKIEGKGGEQQAKQRDSKTSRKEATPKE